MERKGSDMRRFLMIVSAILVLLILGIITATTLDSLVSLNRARQNAEEQVLNEAKSIANNSVSTLNTQTANSGLVALGRVLNPVLLQAYAAGDASVAYNLILDIVGPIVGTYAQLMTLDGRVVGSRLPEGMTAEDFPPPVPEGQEPQYNPNSKQWLYVQVVDDLGPQQGHFVAWSVTVDIVGKTTWLQWIFDRTSEIDAIDANFEQARSSLIWRQISIGLGALLLSLFVVLYAIRLLSKKYISNPMSKMQDKLVRAERLGALGELAGSVSHEMRNPLNVIKSSTFYLRGRLGDADEKVVTHLDRMERSVERADGIINDLLSYSKITTTKPEETDIRRLAETILSEIKVPEGVKVVIKAPDDLPTFWIDPLLVGQVLNNLFLNSFQAMPQGGTVEVELAEETGFFRASVKDDGIGISAENLPKVFEPLFSTKAVGTGFGLAVCKRIVEEQGGTIGIESIEGKGTTVIVQLPLTGGS